MNNTNENNILIAEFMQEGTKGFGIYDFDGYFYNLNELKFHSSWEWLMPVIDKCYQEHMSKHIGDAVLTCNKYKAYKAVVEFIEEYNQNK